MLLLRRRRGRDAVRVGQLAGRDLGGGGGDGRRRCCRRRRLRLRGRAGRGGHVAVRAVVHVLGRRRRRGRVRRYLHPRKPAAATAIRREDDHNVGVLHYGTFILNIHKTLGFFAPSPLIILKTHLLFVY